MVLSNTAVMKAGLDAVIERYNALTAEIDRSLDRLEAEKICDYQPLFRVGDGKPSHDRIRLWARGLWKAMTLAPDTWIALTGVLVEDLVEILRPIDVERLAATSSAVFFESTLNSRSNGLR